jgi:hypothetical protein
MDRLRKLEVNLSVANSAMPGEGTVRSVLSYCGKPVRGLKGGLLDSTYGWYRLSRTFFFGIKHARLCSDLDVPDRDMVMGSRSHQGANLFLKRSHIF